MASSGRNRSRESRNRQEVENSSTSQDMDVLQMLRRVLLNDKLDKLVQFLLRKYQKKEQITMEEMLCTVDPDYREHFPVIFREVCESVCLGFGIDIKEVDPPGHTYVLIPVLGLTYNGILDDDEPSFAKADLLIFILSVIFTKGNRVSEENLKEQLRIWEMLAQMEHIVTGEPWKFISEDLVREQYLEYRQVPDSDPARYEFLWGPRAHNETSKMKLLEHLAKINRRDPRSYPTCLYEDALRDEQGLFMIIEEARNMTEVGSVPQPSHWLSSHHT